MKVHYVVLIYSLGCDSVNFKKSRNWRNILTRFKIYDNRCTYVYDHKLMNRFHTFDITYYFGKKIPIINISF